MCVVYYWGRYDHYYPFCKAMAVCGLTPSSSHMDIILLRCLVVWRWQQWQIKAMMIQVFHGVRAARLISRMIACCALFCLEGLST